MSESCTSGSVGGGGWVTTGSTRKPTAASFGFAYASGGGSPRAFGFHGKKTVGIQPIEETTMWYSAVGCLVTLTLNLLAAPLTVTAQRPTTIPRVGFIGPSSATAAGHFLDAFRQGLRDLGYVEGETIAIEVRWAEGLADRFPDLIAELIRLKVDVLVVGAAAGALAAK